MDVLYCIMTTLDLDHLIMKLVSFSLFLLEGVKNVAKASTKMEEETVKLFLSMELLGFLLFPLEFFENSSYLSREAVDYALFLVGILLIDFKNFVSEI